MTILTHASAVKNLHSSLSVSTDMLYSEIKVFDSLIHRLKKDILFWDGYISGMMSFMDKEKNDALALQEHARLGGKIEINSKSPLKSLSDLNVYYTPGVGAVAARLGDHPEEAKKLTIKRNTVAIISDGSAVLGLGNIGPYGALPVMEGKAMLFKELAGVDAFPLVLDTQDTQEIIDTVVNIAPVFGGINLEDVAAPRCFEIEAALQEKLDIPVMHDDQHGTAIVVLAALINALQVVNKKFEQTKIVVLGAGAAGSAIARLLTAYSPSNLLIVDSKGIIASSRTDLDGNKKALAVLTNAGQIAGTQQDALKGADVVIGVSRGDLLSAEDISLMASNPIVFALSNPVPEIMPQVATGAGAAIVATGRSDFPNQINNALVFPGFFRGALDHGIKKVDDAVKIKVAEALAGLIENPAVKSIVPEILDSRVVPTIARALKP